MSLLHPFLEHILKRFHDKTLVLSPEQTKVFDEISLLVTNAPKQGFSESNNQIDLAFKKLSEVLPQEVTLDHIRKVCNIQLMAKTMGITEGEPLPEKPLEESTITTLPRHQIPASLWWGAYGRGKADLMKLGAEIVGPGEVEIYLHPPKQSEAAS